MATELIYGDAVEVRRELGNPEEEEISTSDIDAGRKRATRLINGYLEALIGSSVPWTTRANVPKLIESIAEDLSVYYVKRMKHPGPAPLDDNTKAEYWEKPMALLEKIMAGDIKLPEVVDAGTEEASIRANRDSYHTTFDVDDEMTQTQDDDLLDHIDGTRDS